MVSIPALRVSLSMYIYGWQNAMIQSLAYITRAWSDWLYIHDINVYRTVGSAVWRNGRTRAHVSRIQLIQIIVSTCCWKAVHTTAVYMVSLNYNFIAYMLCFVMFKRNNIFRIVYWCLREFIFCVSRLRSSLNASTYKLPCKFIIKPELWQRVGISKRKTNLKPIKYILLIYTST